MRCRREALDAKVVKVLFALQVLVASHLAAAVLREIVRAVKVDEAVRADEGELAQVWVERG